MSTSMYVYIYVYSYGLYLLKSRCRYLWLNIFILVCSMGAINVPTIRWTSTSYILPVIKIQSAWRRPIPTQSRGEIRCQKSYYQTNLPAACTCFLLSCGLLCRASPDGASWPVLGLYILRFLPLVIQKGDDDASQCKENHEKPMAFWGFMHSVTETLLGNPQTGRKVNSP